MSVQQQGKSLWERIDERMFDLAGVTAAGRFCQQHARLLTYVLLAGVIAYAADIFSFSLRIDSENHAYGYGAKAAWVSQGRWGMYLLNLLLLPDAIMPVIPILLAVLGSVVGVVLFLKTLSPARGLADYLAAPLVIACPVIYFAFYFTTLSYGVGIAFALGAAGMYALTRWTRQGVVFALLCFCFCIGIYQAVLPLLATLFCLYLVSSVISESDLTLKAFCLRVAGFLLVLALAYLCYDLIKRWMLDYMQIQFDEGYISGFMSYQPTLAYFREAIAKTFLVARDYYTGGKQYYLYKLWSLHLLFYFVLAVTAIRIATAETGWLLRILALLALLAALVAPMLMHVMNNGLMPPRTVLGISHVLGAMVLIAAGAHSRTVQLFTGVLVLACYYNFAVVNNRYAFANTMTWQADRELSLLLIQRINTVLNKFPPRDDPFATYPMELVGWYEYRESPIFVHREVVGASFFTWAAGDVERIERLFHTMGVFDFRAATQQERLSVVEAAEKMPSWPDRGSVDVVNGIIVIKLQEYNPNQFISMCRPPQETHPVCVKHLPH